MPLCWPVVFLVFVLTIRQGRGHSVRSGGTASSGGFSDHGRHLFGCPGPADPAEILQYRAALLYLHSEGVRRVIQLQRHPPHCHGASNDVMTALLRETGLKRLGEPLVIRGGTGWNQLDRWRKLAGPDVAVLVEDAELLEEALGRYQAVRWREGFWFAPGMAHDGRLVKTGRARKFKLLTSTLVDGSKQNWTVPQTTEADNVMKFDDVSAVNVSNEPSSRVDTHPSDSSNSPLPTPPSVLLLRWAAPPLPSERPLTSPQSSLIQVLRSSPWLLAGVYRPGQTTIEPPAALLVQRSELQSHLSAAGCVTWRAELTGADPLTGESVRRSYTERSLPAVAALQGGGPLTVGVHCPQLGAMLHCAVQLERQMCKWEEERSSRRRRETGASREPRQNEGWQPSQWGVEAVQYPEEAPANRQGASGQRQRTTSYRQVAPRQQRAALDQHRTNTAVQTWQRGRNDPHRTGVAEAEYELQLYNHDPYTTAHGSAPHLGGYGSDTYSGYSSDTYPVVFDDHAERRRGSRPNEEAQKLREDFHLTIFPSITKCSGAIAGCFTCVTLLSVLDLGVPAAACVGPCSLGGASACSGAAGTVYREVRRIQKAESKARRRRLGARSQRRVGTRVTRRRLPRGL
ncbi:uncharacterized protein LOC122387113 isoform X2 [Amphibalanus amphitrite]|nr:uncharacterized protein LOC122387113 isoform X2 [Amphibalanus amphitrite]